MQALQTMMARTTAARLTQPMPSVDELHGMVRAAMCAPDHGRLQPWRFIAIVEEGLDRLGQCMAEALALRKPSATSDELARERAKPQRAPMIVVVVACVARESRIPQTEQLAAAAAATQNLLLAATALGYGSAWKTGEAAYDPHVRASLRLADHEQVMGFIYLGAPMAPVAPLERPETTGHLEFWRG